MSDNFIIKKILGYENKFKVAVMAVLVSLCVMMAIYFHLVLQVEMIYTHFFYIPILLAGVWWRRKGLVIPIFLTIVLLSTHGFAHGFCGDFYIDILRIVVFIIVGIMVVYLRERIDKQIDEVRISVKKAGESEVKFGELFENMRSGVAIFKVIGDGEDFVFNEFNKAAEKIENIDRKKLIGKRVTEVFPGVNDLGLFKVFQRVHKTGKSEYLSDTIYTDEKTPATWRENYVYKLPSGEIVSIFEDVTDKKKREIELKESEEKFRLIIESGNSLVYTVDLKGTVTFINDYVKKYGYEFKEVVGRPMSDFCHPEDLKLALEGMARLLKTGEASDLFIMRFKKKDGTFFYGEQKSGIIYKDGKPSAIICNMHDISEKINREILLKESEEKFRALFENSQDALMTLSGPDWNYTSGNKEAIKLFGVKDEKEFLAASPWKYSPKYQPDGQLSADKAKKMIEIAVKDGSNFFEWTHKKLNGDEFFATVLLTRCEAKKEICVQATVRDMTNQKHLELEKIKLQEQFLQSQKMEALGSFVGGIAHDFNNLLTPILSISELSIKEESEKKQARNNFNEIRKSALRGAELVSRLLAFSRKQSLKPKIINLNDLLGNLEKLLVPLIGEHIELKCFFDKKLGNIEFDPVQMEQIILNLAANARDAMPDGGKFTIETQNICMNKDYLESHSEFEAKDYIVMHVSDTGMGMDKETIQYIFDPFYTTKGKAEGTGLGLSTVYGIVKQSGGNISVYSEVGQGTTFKIFLKRSKGEVKIIKSKKVSLDTKNLKGTETILLIEDDESVRKVAVRMLERYGYNLRIAIDGQEAIKICKEHKDIQLIFTDIMLPGGMNGRQIVEEVKVLCPKAKVLFMSGYTDNIIEHHGILDKGINFIQKPFGYQALGEKIRKVLDSK